MRISFSPQFREDALTVSTAGDVLTINGVPFDFSSLDNGDTIPAGAIPCEWIVGPVEKVEGELRLTLILPIGPNPSPAVAFPVPITVTTDGPVAVPHDPAPEEPDHVDA